MATQRPIQSSDWIVEEIPGVHRTWTNGPGQGYWKYWEDLPDGRFRWNPQWITEEKTVNENKTGKNDNKSGADDKKPGKNDNKSGDDE